MNIAIYGYGRMGQIVEETAIRRGHTISGIFDVDKPLGSPEQLRDSDAVISFSLPQAVFQLLEAAAAAGVPVVEGTTGWYEGLERARRIPGLNMVYSPNFSVGVFHFTEIVREAAQRLGGSEGYDCYVHEFHHSGKVDSPSGTARHLGEVILESVPGKNEIRGESCHGRINPEELHITSTRAGRFPGTHEVGFDSDVDLVQVRHTAHGRGGFALGAVLAAEWIAGRKGIYTMREFMNLRQ
jgi:4-hydroxy-tetrahydrodipicolinate reductase